MRNECEKQNGASQTADTKPKTKKTNDEADWISTADTKPKTNKTNDEADWGSCQQARAKRPTQNRKPMTRPTGYRADQRDQDQGAQYQEALKLMVDAVRSKLAKLAELAQLA